jgi:RNA methyltransferase, TrmH family
MPLKISSVQNPRIKQVLHLQKASERKAQQLFIIEGQREIFLAMQSGIRLKTLFYCDEINSEWDKKYFFDLTKLECELILITKEVFEKIAYRENTSGLIAVAEMQQKKLNDLQLPQNPLIVVLENIEKPGNVGAILRTTDAAAIDAVILCNHKTDLFNPNTIRSSIGCVFTNQIAQCSNAEALAFLKQKNIRIITTYLETTHYYHQTDYAQSAALVMGSEADGVSDFWIKNANDTIKIPMSGKIDSINVSTAAAIVIFEAKRQRGF